MRHHKQNRTLGRDQQQRLALLRSLAISLIEKEKIRTTKAKAQELRPFFERLITHGKTSTVASRRQAAARLGAPRPATLNKLFDDIAKRYTQRDGGYTRIIKMGVTRAGREEAVIELV